MLPYTKAAYDPENPNSVLNLASSAEEKDKQKAALRAKFTGKAIDRLSGKSVKKNKKNKDTTTTITPIPLPVIDSAEWFKNHPRGYPPITPANFEYLINLFLDGNSVREIVKWANEQGPYWLTPVQMHYRIKRRYGKEKHALMKLKRNQFNRRKIAAM